MERSTAGEVVASWRESIPNQFPVATRDSVIVMPNHLHGIILIGVNAPDRERAALPTLSRVMQWFKSMTTVDFARGVRSLWMAAASDAFVAAGVLRSHCPR